MRRPRLLVASTLVTLAVHPAAAEPAAAKPVAAEPALPVSSDAPSPSPAPEGEARSQDAPPAEPSGVDAPPDVVAPTPSEPAPLAPDPATDPLLETQAEQDALAALRPPSPFDRGSIRLSVLVGWAQAATTDWLMLGGGVGYYVLDGLEVHADANFWLLGDPFIATVTPGVRYVFHQLRDVKPYVGAFYRHYFVDSPGADSDSIGGRLGVYFVPNPRLYVGGGLVVEQLVNNRLFVDDTQVYPELTIGFAF